MKIQKKRKIAFCYNEFRNVILITRVGGKFDCKNFQHPDWCFKVFECTHREAVNNIKVILKHHPTATVLKLHR